MLTDGGADGLGISRQACVFGTDAALELGELAHELRGLVRLRQARRFERRLSPTEPLDELLQTLGLVGERSSAFEERDARETSRQAVDPDLDVALEAESGVVQTVLQDLCVAGTHDVGISPVRDEGEAVALEREVTLV